HRLRLACALDDDVGIGVFKEPRPRHPAKCYKKHEAKHKSDRSSCCKRLSKCYKKHKDKESKIKCIKRWNDWVTSTKHWSECRAYKASASCFCWGKTWCKKKERSAWEKLCDEHEKERDKHCKKQQKRKRCPFDWYGNIRTKVIIGELP
ncbi:MAG: hypothetical protein SVV80_13710, partial [Planctomycetota bacterium]|nr:hypothetical protein [Planctomycetota bacterium]